MQKKKPEKKKLLGAFQAIIFIWAHRMDRSFNVVGFFIHTFQLKVSNDSLPDIICP